MTAINFYLEDGLEPVSLTLKREDADRFIRFMHECDEATEKAKLWDAINKLFHFPGKTLEEVLVMRLIEMNKSGSQA